MPKIFISYRREDSQHQADRLHAALRRRVANPRRDIFIDVDNIPVGVDFIQHLDAKVSECDVLLALIGPGWSGAGGGARRLDDPKDFVRIEIASALKRGIPVAPILLDGAPMPKESELPDDLKPLARRNAAEIRRTTFDSDAERMIRGLNLKQIGRPQAAKAPPPKSSGAGWAAPVVLLVVLALAGGGAWAWFANPGGWRGTGGLELAATNGAEGSSGAPATPGENPAGISDLPTRLAVADIASGEQQSYKCRACHDFQEGGPNTVGPNLFGVVGRDIGASPGYEYSSAMASVPGAWDAGQLDRWLTSGKAFLPGTKESFAGIADPQARANLIAWLGTLIAKAPSPTTAPTPAAPAIDPAVAKAALDKAKAAFAAAEQQQKRTKEMWDSGLTSQAELAQANAELQSAKSALSAREQDYQRALAATPPAPKAIESFRDCPDCPEMVKIPAGSFMMGSPASEANRSADEGPQRRVTVPAFAAGKYEVTIAEWRRCGADGGCRATGLQGEGGDQTPARMTSWEDVQDYVAWLSRKTGKTYRLLSEAEWEYAARAGTTTPYSFGKSITTSQANFNMELRKTTPVGQYPPNAFGLHDMHGNVWEWVEDCYAESYSAGQPNDGSAYTGGPCYNRVNRGGSYGHGAALLRSAVRSRGRTAPLDNFIGFRVARSLP
jgi:formylglycine-generating enzyme required for sulfatase activity/cytochrome c2